jgi:hypothetical protein
MSGLVLRTFSTGNGSQNVRVKVIDTKSTHDSKLEKLMDYMSRIRRENFTGYIKVNFSQGSIGRVERFEEILKNERSTSRLDP